MNTNFAVACILRYRSTNSLASAATHKLTRLVQTVVTTRGVVIASRLSLRLDRDSDEWLSTLVIDQLVSDAGAASLCIEATRWWVEAEVFRRFPIRSVVFGAHGDVDGDIISLPWRATHLSLTRANFLQPLRVPASLHGVVSVDVSHSNLKDLSVFAELPKLETLRCVSVKSLCSGASETAALGIASRKWPALKCLDLQDAEFIDSIALFEDASNLEVLNIDFCLNINNVEPLRHFQCLRELRMNGVQIQNLSCVSAWPTLEKIAVGYNPYLHDLSPFGHTPNMHSVETSHTGIRDVSWITPCKHVTTVDISHTAVGDITPLSTLQKLTHLRLANTPVKSVGCLGALIPLEELCVNGCDELEDLEALHPTARLRTLEAVGTQIGSVDFLKGCTNLRKLTLRGCVRVRDVVQLQHCAALEYLDISRTSVSSLDPLRWCTSLRHLNCSECAGVNDLSPIQNACELSFLNASCTAVSDVSCLRSCSQLSTLFLERCNQLFSVASLAKHPNLAVVACTHSPILDAVAIESCPRLQYKAFSEAPKVA